MFSTSKPDRILSIKEPKPHIVIAVLRRDVVRDGLIGSVPGLRRPKRYIDATRQLRQRSPIGAVCSDPFRPHRPEDMRFCLRSALARKNAPPRVRVVEILAELAILDKRLGSIPDFFLDSGGRKRLWGSNGDVEVAEGLPSF